MKRALRIKVDGIELAADQYMPSGVRHQRRPAIVMSQGFGAVKDMALPAMAEAFAAAGLVSLLYDHRNFGESGGEPRQEVDPWQQIRDMREVISWLRHREEVDAQRIGLWGTSFSGGHAIVVSAIDRRIRCAVAQVPMVSGGLNMRKTIPSAKFRAFLDELHADDDARAAGVAPRLVPISDEASEGRQWSRTAGEGTLYRNECTLRSLGNFLAYEPGDYVARVAPTPLLFVLARGDTRCPVEDQLEAFQRAREPKKLVLLEGGHFDPYMAQLGNATAAARDWFLAHL